MLEWKVGVKIGLVGKLQSGDNGAFVNTENPSCNDQRWCVSSLIKRERFEHLRKQLESHLERFHDCFLCALIVYIYYLALTTNILDFKLEILAI